ncbi:PREDICTED: WD repeat and HMG-box DNA-binding protein 1-like isoform X2 [Branchiostoma belcheri]|uniref:WD repeat and HMG-box DNA-binding protein 1-like isoform X2 n=1 Tax=Branchiostoma belcheri TaxID=7741 RepID=A0A6P4YAE3_BRABE|nr:PREDICTED: WD repeat and HMG-box DNA-binding protein 1-like isoform X2 [Branchiostoma belcheri]
MPATRKPVRYAHSEGHTDICYGQHGKYLITCGTDGDVRVWEGLEDDDPKTISVGDKIHAVATKDNRLLTGTDSNTVQAHTLSDGAPDGILARFTAPVSHLVYSESGKLLAAGASDFNIRVLKVEDEDSTGQSLFTGHQAPVLSVAVEQEDKYLASSSCDGTVAIWNITEKNQVKSWNLLPKCSDISGAKTLCRLAWQPRTGKYLAVPVEKEVQVFEKDTWEKVITLTDHSIEQPISLVAWSPNGVLLSAACVDGSILVWDVLSKNCVERVKHDKSLTICGLVWNPANGTEIAYTDVQGQLGLVENVAPGSSSKQSDAADDPMAAMFDGDDDDFLLSAGDHDNGSHGNAPGDPDDDDSMPVPTQRKRIKANIFDDDDASIGTDSISMKPASDVLDDVDSISGLPSRAPPQPVYQGPKPTPLQPAFQPGSTPVSLAHRFMVWNSVGVVKCYNSEEENSIDIEFHDTSVHHSMHVTNHLNHTLAALSDQAALLACEGTDDSPSKLVCLHFSSWDNSKEWTTAMTDGEDIQVLAIGQGWVSVATDNRLVRVWTVAGIQKDVISIPGPVVSMAAYGTQLLVVYHMGTGIPGDQLLGAQLLEVMGKRRRKVMEGHLPINPKSTLTWIGFSAEGTPVTYDSSGVVRMMNRGLGCSWTPVANTRSHCKGKSDNYWLVGVNENPQQLRCIPCKGSTFPPVLPRPAVTVLPFQVPLCELNTDKSQLEESFIRSRLFSGHFQFLSSQGWEVDDHARADVQREQDDTLMKLFALACKADRECRAAELCELMDVNRLNFAIKYASRVKRIALAEFLNDLARRKAEEEAEEQQEEEEEEEEQDFRGYLDAQYNHIETEWSQPSTPSVLRSSGSSRQAPRQQQVQQEEEEMDDGEEQEEEEADSSRRSAPILTKNTKSIYPKTSLSLTQERKNPFKVSSQPKTPTETPRGSSVFDKMKKTSPGSRAKSKTGPSPRGDQKTANKMSAVNKKQSTQSTLLMAAKKPRKQEPEKQPKASSEGQEENKKVVKGFDLWFEQERAVLQEENTEESEAGLFQLAIRGWRKLDKQDQKDWNEKAKQMSNTSQDADLKKRKRESESEETFQGDDEGLKGENVGDKRLEDAGSQAKKKRPLSTSVNSKLSAFAFNKD